MKRSARQRAKQPASVNVARKKAKASPGVAQVTTETHDATQTAGLTIRRQATHTRRKVPRAGSSIDTHTQTKTCQATTQTENDGADETESVNSETSMDSESLSSVYQAHTADLVGGNGALNVPLSTSLPTLVPDSIKRQIWANKYVDLASLLPSTNTNYVNQNQNTMMFQMDKFANISLVPKQETKKINSIELWTTAFLRYVAIYSQQHTYETPALMKYAEIVRDLASKRPGTAFLSYDMQFRQLRESVMFPWDRIHMELWLLVTTQPIVNSPQLFRPKSQVHQFQPRPYNQPKSKFLSNTCWSFNRGNQCRNSPCPHPHVCGFCRGQHAANACNNNKSTALNNSQQNKSHVQNRYANKRQ